jgi:hypothetical protein
MHWLAQPPSNHDKPATRRDPVLHRDTDSRRGLRRYGLMTGRIAVHASTDGFLQSGANLELPDGSLARRSRGMARRSSRVILERYKCQKAEVLSYRNRLSLSLWLGEDTL